MSGEPETPIPPKRWKRVGNIFATIVLYGLLLYVLLLVIGIFQWPLEFAFHLIAGPFIHAWKNLPPFLVQWRSALLPLACLAVAVVLAHRFIRWWITSKDIRTPWRWGHTAAAAMLILLGSAAAIAMSGITHQAAWLFSSPWLEKSHSSHLALATNNARQIVLALMQYDADHGRYPDTLDEVVTTMDASPDILWVNTGPGGLREPFIFLKPGSALPSVSEPVLVSPLLQSHNKVVVGFSDTSVKMMPLKTWQKLQKEMQTNNE